MSSLLRLASNLSYVAILLSSIAYLKLLAAKIAIPPIILTFVYTPPAILNKNRGYVQKLMSGREKEYGKRRI